MHVYFSGIGGGGIAPLSLIAKEAGYEVSGSDARPSQYLDYLRAHGITDTHIGVDREFIAKVHARKPIDWFVYGSAQPRDFPDHPEFAFCKENKIKMSKRDEFLSQIITSKKLKLIAIAGTHGKTTVTAMATWVFKELGLALSYSGGAKLSFGEISEFNPKSEYFVYETDEYDRNFLSFKPELALISGVDWDHPDVYPTRDDYYAAFGQFLKQSKHSFIWQDDAVKLGVPNPESLSILNQKDSGIDHQLDLAGHVNRKNAWLVAHGLSTLLGQSVSKLIEVLDRFPGLPRRFEQIAPGVYSDSAHTPAKIRGALQMAHEVAGDNVVVVYEGLHNLRQHFIKDELANLFASVKQLYVVPSFLAREDPNLEILTPEKILDLLSNSVREHAVAAALDESLAKNIRQQVDQGNLVICLTGGNVGSLDEWLRKEFGH